MSKLVIIGFGHMGSAIAAGAIGAGVVKAADVTVADALEENLGRAKALGVNTCKDNRKAVSGADTVIIAVKPNNLAALAGEICESVKGAVIVSICAGKRIETLKELFGESAKIIRVMPNTPALAGEGMAALCRSENVSDGEMEYVLGIFRSFGRAEMLGEELFDAVTAVSGSGPAYVYAFIDALMKYAAESGMTYEQAKIFSAQTVLGAAKLALMSKDSPQKLKENVCSPGGTTIEAVKVLDERGFEDIIRDAAKACEEKSRKLANA